MGSIESGPVEAAQLVDYQADAIVSRQVMKMPAGSVTAFAFDAGQALSEHTTPHEALLHVVDGEAHVDIAGVRCRTRSGEMIRLPAGVPHTVQAEGRFKMLLVMIRSGA